MTGKVYLVGSGPGGLDLMTFKAREVIDSADVILYDQLPGEEVINSLPDVEKVDVGKYGGKHTREQDEIENLMAEYALKGKNVVRLKGGDPFLFGRGGEEMEYLRAKGIEVETVPGITSGIAVPENVGIPVTHRTFASQVTFLTGHEDPTKPESAINWRWLAESPGTIVILMGVKNLPNITKSLIENGMDSDKPVAIIERGFRADQRVTTGKLSDIADIAKERGVRPPAIIVIGEVVSLYRE
ncbi:uroporphyrinogen-III C-methyltransferase [Methanoplanus endosymbiosus]|uniref:uroporphyrinogen-III C-methyltransferase n=1 Tax=Methanoplanus endosymbiosus TaxID=33865 RepID=A0A9E7PRV4_9EURY|nr:uroporphyrinogen-III C-methyltransferase [Methanoplanus endosymbiosus]UUX92467.1 uroporphyrinogen-III C-methyltransferase [Methanoplanus endosymbiosus]